MFVGSRADSVEIAIAVGPWSAVAIISVKKLKINRSLIVVLPDVSQKV